MSRPIPEGFTQRQDYVMAIYAELCECPWHDVSKLPNGITQKMKDDWFELNGYRRNKRSRFGWARKKAGA
jgi:hypothetical protein